VSIDGPRQETYTGNIEAGKQLVEVIGRRMELLRRRGVDC
jgi:hypothetical protein